MRVLAISGGIASGKSVAAAFFRSRGVPVYDSDSRAKTLYAEDAGLAKAVAKVCGEEVLSEAGGIDLRRLAKAVFGDESKRRAVEALVHPAVLKDFKAWRQVQAALGAELAAIESAILPALPLFKGSYDKLLVIEAPLEERLRRIKERNGLGREAALKRVLSQPSHFPGADWLIVNEGSLSQLEARLEAVLEALRAGA